MYRLYFRLCRNTGGNCHGLIDADRRDPHSPLLPDTVNLWLVSRPAGSANTLIEKRGTGLQGPVFTSIICSPNWITPLFIPQHRPTSSSLRSGSCRRRLIICSPKMFFFSRFVPVEVNAEWILSKGLCKKHLRTNVYGFHVQYPTLIGFCVWHLGFIITWKIPPFSFLLQMIELTCNNPWSSASTFYL